jgi:transposase
VERIPFQSRIIPYERLDQRPIVYIDESGFALDTLRTQGYSPMGNRCYGVRDWHAWGRVNVIGAIGNFEFITVDLWNCYIDADVCYEWLTLSLLPKLPPRSVVVMANAAFHKRQDMIEALERDGHTPQCLLPYSFDLNSIEKQWAQAKALRRQLRCDPCQLFSNAKV